VAFTGPSEAGRSIRELHETYGDAVAGATRQVVGEYTDELTVARGDWVFSRRH
jgi:hypothetical protein